MCGWKSTPIKGAKTFSRYAGAEAQYAILYGLHRIGLGEGEAYFSGLKSMHIKI